MKKSILVYRTIPSLFAVLASVWLGLGLFAIPDANAQASGSPVFLVKSGDSIGGKILEVVAGLENLGRLSYNNHGVVAFRGLWADGAGWFTDGIFTQHELIFTSPDAIAGHRVVAVGGPSINDSGVVTFVGSWDDDADGFTDGRGIFTQNDLLFEDGTTIGGLIVEGLTHFDFPVINASGKVAFQATINNVPNSCVPPSSCFPRALFTQDDVVVREGDVIGGNGIHYMQAPFKFPTYDFNDVGEVVFLALTDVAATNGPSSPQTSCYSCASILRTTNSS